MITPPDGRRRNGFAEKVIEFSARNRFFVILVVAAAVIGAVWAVKHVPLDAIPDLSDTQVIIYSRWDRSPDLIENQVTYPIITSLLGAPEVKAIRGFSDFGFSYVYVIFKDGTDVYWARSRVLEYLSKISSRLPEGVQTELGPDASGVGWVFQYALTDPEGKHSLEELRSFQDWTLRFLLQSVPGVAEVSSLGGDVKQYQIAVDPSKLLAYDIPLMSVVEAVRKGNQEAGGRLMEFAGAEYMIRGRAYAKSVEDLQNVVVGLGTDPKRTPVLLKHVADVSIGREIRRGVADLDGKGDVVTGTVIMRYGENALNVIRAVKTKLKEIGPSLPEGVKIVPVYDRSDLILRAIDTLRHQLVEEMIVVSLVIILFLWHFPSAAVPIVTIPIAVLLSFIPLYYMRLTSNIMSLSGIAISIGVLVDGAIIEVENVYKRLEQWHRSGRKGDYHEVLLEAMKEVGPSVFFSLLVIAVAFVPIFALIDQEGRLFRPLAWSKNLSMAIAAVLAITLDPALRTLFTRMKPFEFRPRWIAKAATGLAVGTYYSEEKHPVSRVLFRVYEPVCRWVLRHRKTTLAVALLLVLTTIPIFRTLGSEFMPPLWEGDVLYMPTTLPGISADQAEALLKKQDEILKSFPEVERVFGKAGRIESSTDPAPLSMVETVVLLKPEGEWRKDGGRPITHEALISKMDEALKIPGATNAWTLPIKNRIDMLTTGVRTPVGIKILGADLKTIEEIGAQIERIVKTVPGTRSVYAERVTGGYFIDFDVKREELARWGLSVDDIVPFLMGAGGENISTTVEGRGRYPINVRFVPNLRDDLERVKQLLLTTPAGKHVPLGRVADVRVTAGPSMIRNENGLLAGYVFVDMAGRDIGGYVDEAKRMVNSELRLPQGYALVWSGQYENMIRVRNRLKTVVPLTLFIIFLLLYMNTRSAVKTGIILLAVPFSLVGAVWLLSILGYHMSIAVWVGMIALMGLDAETGVFMLLFLDLSYRDAVEAGRMKTKEDLEEAIVHGAVKRVRPKLMTVMAAFIGLLPIMWAHGSGADMMKRIAAPMIGGLATSFILELLVYPVIYAIWKWKFEMKRGKVIPGA